MIPDTYSPTARVVHELVLSISYFCSSQCLPQIVNIETEWAMVVLRKTIFSNGKKIMNALIQNVFILRHMEITIMTVSTNSTATVNRD